MVTKKSTLEKIRKIVEKHYNRLVISVLGNKVFTDEELKKLQALGVDTSNPDSLLTMVYYHNFINNPIDEVAPKSVGDMKSQQVKGLKPEGQANDYAIEGLNDSAKQYIDKLKIDIMTKLESIIRENNEVYRLNALQNLDRDELLDDLVKESSLGKLKQKLRDTSKEANRNWLRVALTSASDAIGAGSVDRIVTDNRTKDASEIYVYKITVKDSITCKWCRRFYNDSDGSPRLYRLSTLLSNGSNYGKATQDWMAVVGATHPNTRTSQVIELKPGFALKPDGTTTYIGLDKWKDYIVNKLTA